MLLFFRHFCFVWYFVCTPCVKKRRSKAALFQHRNRSLEVPLSRRHRCVRSICPSESGAIILMYALLTDWYGRLLLCMRFMRASERRSIFSLQKGVRSESEAKRKKIQKMRVSRVRSWVMGLIIGPLSWSCWHGICSMFQSYILHRQSPVRSTKSGVSQKSDPLSLCLLRVSLVSLPDRSFITYMRMATAVHAANTRY